LKQSEVSCAVGVTIRGKECDTVTICYFIW